MDEDAVKICLQIKATSAEADDWCEAVIAYLIEIEGVEVQGYWITKDDE